MKRDFCNFLVCDKKDHYEGRPVYLCPSCSMHEYKDHHGIDIIHRIVHDDVISLKIDEGLRGAHLITESKPSNDPN